MRNGCGVLRTIGVILFLGMLSVSLPVAQAQQRGGAGTAGKTAGETGKNIQVLKGLPADQLNPTMRFFAYSLGVECAFCHALPDQSSDAKQTKLTARNMIKMVMEINKNNFNSKTEVTCFTCHRGTQDPTIAPVVESTKIIPGGTAPPAAPAAGRGGGRGGAAAEPAEPALPSADAIVAKYVQALGGEQALRKIASSTITGTFDNAGRNTQDVPWTQGTFELDEKAPNLRMLAMRSPDGQATTIGFDGTVSWTQTPNGAVTEDTGMGLERMRRVADLRSALDLKQQDAHLEVREAQKIGGRDAYLVVAYANSDAPEQLYFDTQSGLLLRRTIVSESLVTAPPVQIDYQDYRDADGVKYAATVKISDVIATPMYTVLHVNKMDFAPIDAAKFTKPASAHQAGGGRGGRGGGGGRGGQ